ncbi:hypothetical protein CBR_g20145 [Chara braunii]|uniref:Uncharacterized protein n=1 Tax=Chara braunii TaxID=69332 RepID=A0A388KZM4_CHABU|nr:hypothetical protein CBR_g20145 [Chara braunii]|eukprot:GBG75514.1 hypothetical protein CBR_g20145 [Chara braunii]
MQARGRGRGRGRWSNCGRYWMETPPPPPPAQPPAAPFSGSIPYQTPVNPFFPPFGSNPLGYNPIPPNFIGAQPQAPWPFAGVSSAPAQSGGQYSQGYGRGNEGYQNCAFFTREHADFIEKLKLKDAVDEARKKDLEEIARLMELGMEWGKKKEVEKDKEFKEKKRKQGKDKGKGKIVDDGKEHVLKKWVATNFGGSLKILAEKLEEVDKKSKLKDDELEELKMLRAEKELRELRESSSSEKRKREMASPSRPVKGKVRSRSALLRKRGKEKTQKPVEVLSDEEGREIEKDGVVQNLSGKMESSFGGGKDLVKLKELLRELLAGGTHAAGSSNTAVGQDRKQGEDGFGRGEQEGDAGEPQKMTMVTEKNEEGEKEEGSLGLYFKDRVIYYDALHYTKIQTLCKKKGIPYKRKEGV